ncbi:MAG TPA: hypothetical protein VN709_13275 [Terriglobales bacterium]|nr:hypothetical protein [Terriglobales bacterium]
MSDPVRFSLWFLHQPVEELLPRLAQAAAVLPAEALERGVRGIALTAVDWNQPALVEERFDTGISLDAATDLLRPFTADDCACEWQLSWSLWMFQESEWRQRPMPITFTNFGRRFADHNAVEDGDMVIDFGLDEIFLAELAPWTTSTRQHLQANILQLLAMCHKLQAALSPVRRQLWSEAEENSTLDLSERLAQRLQLSQLNLQ